MAVCIQVPLGLFKLISVPLEFIETNFEPSGLAEFLFCVNGIHQSVFWATGIHKVQSRAHGTHGTYFGPSHRETQFSWLAVTQRNHQKNCSLAFIEL